MRRIDWKARIRAQRRLRIRRQIEPTLSQQQTRQAKNPPATSGATGSWISRFRLTRVLSVTDSGLKCSSATVGGSGLACGRIKPNHEPPFRENISVPSRYHRGSTLLRARQPPPLFAPIRQKRQRRRLRVVERGGRERAAHDRRGVEVEAA